MYSRCLSIFRGFLWQRSTQFGFSAENISGTLSFCIKRCISTSNKKQHFSDGVPWNHLTFHLSWDLIWDCEIKQHVKMGLLLPYLCILCFVCHVWPDVRVTGKIKEPWELQWSVWPSVNCVCVCLGLSLHCGHILLLHYTAILYSTYTEHVYCKKQTWQLCL